MQNGRRSPEGGKSWMGGVADAVVRIRDELEVEVVVEVEVGVVVAVFAPRRTDNLAANLDRRPHAEEGRLWIPTVTPRSHGGSPTA
jgi:hypothetical protein